MKKGDFIKIEFVGRLESGEVFDLTDEDIAKKEDIYNKNLDYSPIPVIVGEGFVIEGLDEALQDMEVGEEKKVTIPPEKGFGKRNPNLVRTLSKNAFKRVPKPGMVIATPSGARGRVQSISSGRVRVDFNNPLAGKNLKYEVKVNKKIKDDVKKVKSIFKFFKLDPEVKTNDREINIELKKLNSELENKAKDLIKKYTKFEKVKIEQKEKEKNKKENKKSKNDKDWFFC